MGIPERNWQGVIELARGYSAARRALDDVAERIKAYEDEFHEQAERTREKMARRRNTIESVVLATVEVIGTEDAEKGKFGGAVDALNTKFREIPDSAQHWLAPAISEIAITLQAKVAFETINPLWVEESHLTDLARLKNEHESHMRSQLWGASSWIQTEERFARDFKTLLEVVKGSRRRKVAKTILMPKQAMDAINEYAEYREEPMYTSDQKVVFINPRTRMPQNHGTLQNLVKKYALKARIAKRSTHIS